MKVFGGAFCWCVKAKSSFQNAKINNQEIRSRGQKARAVADSEKTQRFD